MSKSSWAKPSLSRDFAILVGVILFVLLLLSVWVTWSTYNQQSKNILTELEKEASRIDLMLEREMGNTGYLLSAIGQQIANMNTNDKREIARLLKTYHMNNNMYAIWSWADTTQHVTVSSNYGVLDEPVDVVDRDYIQKAQASPWQLQIGNPIQGRVSDRWVIPVAVGVTDDASRFLGTITASVDINALTQGISHLIKRDGISFAIISKTFVPLTEVSDVPNFVGAYFAKNKLDAINLSERPAGILSRAKIIPFFHGIYAYYQLSRHYPYVLLIGYDVTYSQAALERQLLPRLLQIITLAAFLLLFLWLVRVRLIKPVVHLNSIISRLTHGESYHHDKQVGPLEIDQLAGHIATVSDFIDERKRVEEELREKLEQQLQKEKNRALEKQTLIVE